MKQILAFGDSNTWGFNPDTKERFDWGIRWTSIVQEQMKEEQVRIIEEGLCGRTTVFEDELRAGRKGSEALPFLLESHAPLDAVILMLGTNDCKSIYHTNEIVIGKGIESLVKAIRHIQPQTQILLVSPIWLGESVWKSEFDPEFDKQGVAVSKKLKAVYEDIARRYDLEFLAASDYAVPSEADMEHMDEENHRKLAREIEVVLRRML